MNQPAFLCSLPVHTLYQRPTMLKLLLFLLFFLSGFHQTIKKPYLAKWVITKGCSLKVVGSTNVNQFSCVIADYYKPDTLTFYKDAVAEPTRITGTLKLEVQNFDCLNPVMTANLRNTLKAKENPYLIIKFINLSRYPANYTQNGGLKGVVSIQLAGVTKRYEVDYRFIPNGAKALTLVGTRQVNFSDFDIIPPRKIGGMIQTRNELDVQFSLKAKILY
ncbi:MAG: hypothetical protein COW65_06090 [Cytophagales bacterium CG18_big_fil_WC_8_21_14_2_50_42_9]|nr:MAG: hypothetical protein COW65_06090 [Cytophagales bacterium CG18_big_fil_WC_8_21_14_2_50_42_9]